MLSLKGLLLVAISLISLTLVADENILRTESISISVSNTNDGREKTTSFDGSRKGEVIKRTLTVSAGGGDIKDVSVLAGGGMTVVSEDKKGLTITGLQRKGSDIGDFEMVVSGRVVPKTSSTGKGKGDATLPPKEDPWNFSGTGKYSIGKCTNRFKIVYSNESYIFPGNVYKYHEISPDMDGKQVDLLQTIVNNSLTTEKLTLGSFAFKPFPMDRQTSSSLKCKTCGNNLTNRINYAYLKLQINPETTLLSWKNSSQACAIVKNNWNNLLKVTKEHENGHYNIAKSAISPVLGQLKYTVTCCESSEDFKDFDHLIKEDEVAIINKKNEISKALDDYNEQDAHFENTAQRASVMSALRPFTVDSNINIR